MATRLSWAVLIALIVFPFQAMAGMDDTLVLNAVPGEPRPTVIFLHGGNSTGPKFSSYININVELGKRGAVAIYPTGFRGHWNDGRGGSPRNDIKYLDSMIDYYVAKKIIDPNHLYLAGISNGGMMAFGMLCASGYRFKGVMIVGATFPRIKPMCSKIKPAPTILIYGSEDKFFPPDGVTGNSWHGTAGVASRAATLDFLRTANGCVGNVLPIDSGDMPGGVSVQMRPFKCATPLWVFDLIGTGHVWPGAAHFNTMEREMGPNPASFAANDILIKSWFGQ